MAIIYTYPTVLPAASDILLGTEVGATLRNPTKNFKIGDIAAFVIDSIAGTTLTLPIFFDVTNAAGVTSTTLVDSIMTQDANPAGNTLTIAGTLSVTGALRASNGKPGDQGQVLKSTVTGIEWGAVNSTTEVIAFTNVALVTANHTGALGTFPSVTIVNNNNIILFGEVRYITTTQITITFATPQSGNVYLN